MACFPGFMTLCQYTLLLRIGPILLIFFFFFPLPSTLMGDSSVPQPSPTATSDPLLQQSPSCLPSPSLRGFNRSLPPLSLHFLSHLLSFDEKAGASGFSLLCGYFPPSAEKKVVRFSPPSPPFTPPSWLKPLDLSPKVMFNQLTFKLASFPLLQHEIPFQAP